MSRGVAFVTQKEPDAGKVDYLHRLRDTLILLY